jgi:hypothetical protein
MIVDAAIPLPTPPAQGAYAVVVLDASNAELTRWPFDVSFAAPADGNPPPFVPFNFTLPYPPGAACVRVLHGGSILAELCPPAQGPSVAFQSLSVEGDTVHAQWAGSHPQGAPLTYALHFSPDGGQTRLPLAPALSTNVYTWTTELAQGTDDARLIVVATDGFHTAEAYSESFSIPRRPPVAAISAPAGTRQAASAGALAPLANVLLPASASAVANQPVELRGSGFDLNDGYLQNEALRWASDLEGPLGIGERLTVRLRAGTHTLVLQAVSTAGLIGSDSVVIEVLADGDGDGLPDVYEDAHACLSSRDAHDARQDQDQDGLTALAEYRLGTDPCLADTDGDGINDGVELLGGSNPLERSSVPLPTLAPPPPPLHFVGCDRLPAPTPQTIPLVGASVPYSVTTDVPWLHATRQPNGDLEVRVSCSDVQASPAAGSILVTASGRQPLLIPATLAFYRGRIYLPVLMRNAR